jgi:hypothetical protein
MAHAAFWARVPTNPTPIHGIEDQISESAIRHGNRNIVEIAAIVCRDPCLPYRGSSSVSVVDEKETGKFVWFVSPKIGDPTSPELSRMFSSPG